MVRMISKDANTPGQSRGFASMTNANMTNGSNGGKKGGILGFVATFAT